MTTRFLLDANLSSRSRHWQTSEFESVPTNADWGDTAIWQHATQHNLTILTKDKDFEEKALRYAPPQVVRFCVGNMGRRQFREFLSEVWPRVLAALEQPGVRLVRVYADRLESS